MMKSREFKKFYHPRMGRYVYKHRGNGLIVDTLMKPLKAVASTVLKEVVKPFGKNMNVVPRSTKNTNGETEN